MSILDEYDSLERKNDKELIIKEFKDIDLDQVPAAYKAWFDVMFEYLEKDIPFENKATILYLFDQCDFNYRIYLRDFGYECPIVTVVEKWDNKLRNKDLITTWTNMVLAGCPLHKRTIEDMVLCLIGMGKEDLMEVKGERWVIDYFVYSLTSTHPFTPILGYKNKPVQSNYHKYKQYIYQLLETYNIKKESE